MRSSLLVVCLLLGFASLAVAADGVQAKSEFIYDKAAFPSVHASTLAATKEGLLCAFFGGTAEGKKDVGIWLSRHDGKTWSEPVEVASGVQANGERHPCWNPVLHTLPDGVVVLFFKVGPKPSNWWGEMLVSTDGGKTWKDRQRLPDGILGPVKNKAVALANGTLLCPSSTEHAGWQAHMEFAQRQPDGSFKFTRTDPLCDGKQWNLIQPTLLHHGDKWIALCRSKGAGKIVAMESSDEGKTWSAPAATELPNPNSGIDGVTLADGRSLLVYNHTRIGRSPLNLAVSADGKTWKQVAVLDEQLMAEFSYPAIIQSPDGLVHITYTWKRQKVKHVVIDPKKI